MLAFSQGEANIWYFGANAGVDFNGPTPVALTNGQINTIEGCAVLSNNLGQLLFYTDGITIYNKNHVAMVNGTGLMGHSSSTHSATIVQKPGSTNLFYVFTLDAFGHQNGFRYSIVDMALDGGNGAVTSEKNVLIYTPSSEKLSVVKHPNNNDYWIVTMSYPGNTFYAHLLTSSGISATPVTSSAGVYITTDADDNNVIGQMKISPSGNKLVVCSSYLYIAQLFDFNASTGQVSNAVTIYNNPGSMSNQVYGAEFSPNGEVLYLSKGNFQILQYNVYAVDVPASLHIIDTGNSTVSALQLGRDGKIYGASYTHLSAINNPNVLGDGCNFVPQAIYLEERFANGGLPTFCQSFFYTPSINLSTTCQGDTSNFSFSTNQSVLNASWNFGDGTTSNQISPTHTYANPGNYTVTVTITTPAGTGSNTRNITIHPRPILLQNTLTLKQCDDNNDGFSAFNLRQTETMFVSSTSDLTFTYYTNLTDAQNNTANAIIANPIAYTNPLVNADVVYVRIENGYGCYSIGQINLIVSTTVIPPSFQKTFTVCDDALSGSATDGIATFDLSSVTTDVQSLFPIGQLLTITYYDNLADALAEQNAITNLATYTNTTHPTLHYIYIRVDSQVNNECLGLGQHITLHVEPVPFISDLVIRHCDDNQDGSYAFNTSTLQNTILNGLTNVTITYIDQNNQVLPSPLPNPFVTVSQTVTVRVTNNTSTACYDEATLQFIVDDLPEVFTIPTSLTTSCDNEVNPLNQNGSYPFNTTTFESTLVGTQTGVQVFYYDQNNQPLPSPLPNPFETSTQTIRVEVVNPLNTSCSAVTYIPFIVHPLPEISLIGDELVCSNDPTFTKIINAGVVNNSLISTYTYQWFYNGVLISGQTNYDLTVNTEGVYTVVVTNLQGCSRTRTITVTASSNATIENVYITDLSVNNSVLILVSGTGDYVYSIDGQTWQTSNEFSHLESGVYTVYVKDLNGCGSVSREISLLGIPNFFTPNGDGFNDYWNIKGIRINYNSKSTVFIYDRYGKLLSEINPLSQGWDGTLNGVQLPATDYWYTIFLEDGRTFKGHFSLKR